MDSPTLLLEIVNVHIPSDNSDILESLFSCPGVDVEFLSSRV